MSLCRLLFLVSFLALSTHVSAQSKADKKVIKALRADIGYLASDELEGRRTSTEGESKAADYIIRRYTALKIPPYGAAYRHPFKFVWGREMGSSSIYLGGRQVKLGNEVFPFSFSASKDVSGDVLTDVQEQGSIWILPMYASEDEAKDPHFDAEKIAWEKAREAAKTGATGVLFYDPFNSKYAPSFNPRSEYETVSIPVAFADYDQWQKLTANGANTISLQLQIHLSKPERTGTNIAAYIDNKAPLTVVLGAHYDHLGYGEDGGSLYTGRERQIHNGADDNASGTAALIQLAEWVKKNKLKHYNYLFAHFTGEELGLFGSKAFMKEAGMDSSHVAYMINMDMVGRLSDSTHALTLGGVGTSPAWADVVADGRATGFTINIDSAGVGPSDHTSFYNAGIPVLFFFTGVHPDYHKPTDDADKINYPGEATVITYVESVIKKMNGKPRPIYTPTRQSSMGRVRFKVTLGIIPDYSWQGEGVRVDGVSQDKPAQKAGILVGDVIIHLGNDDVKGMQSYMDALSHQKEGAKSTVTILRDGKKQKLPIQFR
jgi:aminopeptidase YwaD